MIHRHRGNRRKQNITKALRKAKIIKNLHDYWSYNSLHELSKGKIHCSCGICTIKTNSSYVKSRGPVDPNRNFCRPACTNYRYGRKCWSPADRKKIDNMNYQIFSYKEGE